MQCQENKRKENDKNDVKVKIKGSVEEKSNSTLLNLLF